MRRDNLKISVKVDDFILALCKRRDKEIKDYEKYKTRYSNESLKYFKQSASKLRKIADKMESGHIPQEATTEHRNNNKNYITVPINLMRIPCLPDTEPINSLIKALEISSSKTISLDRWEYENYFSEEKQRYL